MAILWRDEEFRQHKHGDAPDGAAESSRLDGSERYIERLEKWLQEGELHGSERQKARQAAHVCLAAFKK